MEWAREGGFIFGFIFGTRDSLSIVFKAHGAQVLGEHAAEAFRASFVGLKMRGLARRRVRHERIWLDCALEAARFEREFRLSRMSRCL